MLKAFNAVHNTSRCTCDYYLLTPVERHLQDTTILTLVDEMKTFGCRLTLGTKFDENLVGGS